MGNFRLRGEKVADRILTAKEAAAFLRMSVQQLYKLKNANQIPCHKVGSGRAGKVLFLESELLEWVRDHGNDKKEN